MKPTINRAGKVIKVFTRAWQGLAGPQGIQGDPGDVSTSSIVELNDVYDSMTPIAGQVLTFNATNGWQSETPASVITSHLSLSDIGSYTHEDIDSHVDSTAIHFTMGSISIGLSQVSDSGTMAAQDASSVAITGGTAALTSVQLAGGTGDQGKLTWNVDEETLDLVLDGTTLQLGQEVHIHVRNTSGSTLPAGSPVMATGTVGASGRIIASLMDGTDALNVKYYLGITTEAIATGEDGKVSTLGKVRSIDTTGTPYSETWSEGDVIWIDTTTAGNLTNVEPTSGLSLPIAFVVTGHASTGTLFSRALNIDNNAYNKLGSGYQTIKTVDDTDSPYSVLVTDSVIFVDASAGAVAINMLPSASGVNGTSGLNIAITKIDTTANVVTINGDAAETIAGSLAQTLEYEQESITIIPDGSNWHLNG